MPLRYPHLQAGALAQALSSPEPTRPEQPFQLLAFSLNAHDFPSPDKADQPQGSSSGRWEDSLQMREPSLICPTKVSARSFSAASPAHGRQRGQELPTGKGPGLGGGTAPAAASPKTADHVPQTPTWGQKPELWLPVTCHPLSRERDIPQHTHRGVVLCTLNSHRVTCQLFLSKTRKKERVRRGPENRRESESPERRRRGGEAGTPKTLCGQPGPWSQKVQWEPGL